MAVSSTSRAVSAVAKLLVCQEIRITVDDRNAYKKHVSKVSLRGSDIFINQ